MNQHVPGLRRFSEHSHTVSLGTSSGWLSSKSSESANSGNKITETEDIIIEGQQGENIQNTELDVVDFEFHSPHSSYSTKKSNVNSPLRRPRMRQGTFSMGVFRSGAR
jgi:hypothetical protein